MYTHLGPSYWTENRTDDIITDIDIIIKGWHDVSEVPTFIKHVHLFDEELYDLYGDCIWIEFLVRVRDEIKFSSVEKLIEQLEKDKSNCLSLKHKYELGEEDAHN